MTVSVNFDVMTRLVYDSGGVPVNDVPYVCGVLLDSGYVDEETYGVFGVVSVSIV